MEMTYHCRVERADRVQHIIDRIGLGQIVKERYYRSIEEVTAGKPGHYICITNTGITLVKTEDKRAVITMYVTTYRELVKVYDGAHRIPAYLHKRVDRNQSHFIRNGKTTFKAR